MARPALLFFMVLVCLALLGTRNTQAENSWLARADYRLHARITLDAVEEDASGLAFDPVSRRLWLINNNARLFELDAEGKILREIILEGFNDPEGVAWLGNTNGTTRLALSEERRGKILELEIPPYARLLKYEHARVLARLGKSDNHGVEGLATNPDSGEIFLINEHSPKAAYGIDGPQLEQLWQVGWQNFWRHPMDYSGLAYVTQTNSLLLLSDRSRDLREYTLKGEQLAKLDIEASDPEGVAIAPDGTLYICSEPKQLLIYKPTGLPGKTETADLDIDAGLLSGTVPSQD